ncbi:MAG: glycoside hydrolase family 15 protein, partial [Pseudomonas stutzeri]|nr:glycoside hydrolase family 15 protein [Stutzerimonas stutzeri]
GGEALGLCSPVPLQVLSSGVESEFTLTEGEHLYFILNYAANGDDPLAGDLDGDRALTDTIAYWQRWLSQCTYQGR